MELMFKSPTEPYKADPVIVEALDKLFILHGRPRAKLFHFDRANGGFLTRRIVCFGICRNFCSLGGHCTVEPTKRFLKCWKKFKPMVAMPKIYCQSQRQKRSFPIDGFWSPGLQKFRSKSQNHQKSSRRSVEYFGRERSGFGNCQKIGKAALEDEVFRFQKIISKC